MTIKYMPILKAKAGEMWSLTNLKPESKEKMAPVIELVLPKQPSKADYEEGKRAASLNDQVKKDLKKLHKAWGSDQLVFIDTKWIQQEYDFGNAGWIWQECTNLGLNFAPVITIDDSASFRSTISKMFPPSKGGPLLRLHDRSLSNHSEIDDLLCNCGHTASSVHFLLDYKGKQMALPNDMVNILHLNAWKTFTAASGIFPVSLSQYPVKSWSSIQRTCWKSWKQKVTTKPSRKPTFSDYATRNQGAAPGGGAGARVGLRYTISDEWLVYPGQKRDTDTSQDIFKICSQLVDREEFCGEGFSAGDDEIIKRAEKATKNPGGPQAWTQWGISHHLEFVASQV